MEAGGGRIDNATYEALIRAFKLKHGNVSHAASQAKTSRDVAKRAWAFGWPEQGFEPIKKVIESERTAARAALRKEFVEEARLEEMADPVWEQERARQQAIRALVEEGELIGKLRVSILTVASEVSAIVRETRGMSKKIAEYIQQNSNPIEALVYLNQSAALMQRVAAAGQTVMQMERLHLGQPEKILGVVTKQTMTLEEAAAELEATNRAFNRAREMGLLPEPKKASEGK